MLDTFATLAVLLVVVGILAIPFFANNVSSQRTVNPWWSAPHAGLGGL